MKDTKVIILPEEIAEMWAESIVEDAQLDYEGDDWCDMEGGEGYYITITRYHFRTEVPFMGSIIELMGDLNDGRLENFIADVVEGDDCLLDNLDLAYTEVQLEEYISKIRLAA